MIQFPMINYLRRVRFIQKSAAITLLRRALHLSALFTNGCYMRYYVTKCRDCIGKRPVVSGLRSSKQPRNNP
jgi:hypothetical protein